MSSQNLADYTVKITSVLNKHLAEENCICNIHDIVKEFFQD
jgi:hypothetical protein